MEPLIIHTKGQFQSYPELHIIDEKGKVYLRYRLLTRKRCSSCGLFLGKDEIHRHKDMNGKVWVN